MGEREPGCIIITVGAAICDRESGPSGDKDTGCIGDRAGGSIGVKGGGGSIGDKDKGSIGDITRGGGASGGKVVPSLAVDSEAGVSSDSELDSDEAGDSVTAPESPDGILTSGMSSIPPRLRNWSSTDPSPPIVADELPPGAVTAGDSSGVRGGGSIGVKGGGKNGGSAVAAKADESPGAKGGGNTGSIGVSGGGAISDRPDPSIGVKGGGAINESPAGKGGGNSGGGSIDEELSAGGSGGGKIPPTPRTGGPSPSDPSSGTGAIRTSTVGWTSGVGNPSTGSSSGSGTTAGPSATGERGERAGGSEMTELPPMGSGGGSSPGLPSGGGNSRADGAPSGGGRRPPSVPRSGTGFGELLPFIGLPGTYDDAAWIFFIGRKLEVLNCEMTPLFLAPILLRPGIHDMMRSVSSAGLRVASAAPGKVVLKFCSDSSVKLSTMAMWGDGGNDGSAIGSMSKLECRVDSLVNSMSVRNMQSDGSSLTGFGSKNQTSWAIPR
jgi:hypothetical protein